MDDSLKSFLSSATLGFSEEVTTCRTAGREVGSGTVRTTAHARYVIKTVKNSLISYKAYNGRLLSFER